MKGRGAAIQRNAAESVRQSVRRRGERRVARRCTGFFCVLPCSVRAECTGQTAVKLFHAVARPARARARRPAVHPVVGSANGAADFSDIHTTHSLYRARTSGCISPSRRLNLNQRFLSRRRARSERALARPAVCRLLRGASFPDMQLALPSYGDFSLSQLQMCFESGLHNHFLGLI